MDPDAEVGGQEARGVSSDGSPPPVAGWGGYGSVVAVGAVVVVVVVAVVAVVVGALGLVVVDATVDGMLGCGRLGSSEEVGVGAPLDDAVVEIGAPLLVAPSLGLPS
jgi:hypothetical protein